ncbi:hypothetical protein Tsubulata_040414 [Turnera subulata]|uniref:Core-2/I-branching beta-1,6-N-acetylglucosaminyltransferase family protein n=1 Tax=Turnera subulata TaxID=218843 RepID=A0A9Q0JD06_9ROSI|nr:hypothetical protein Tsubulata_040414 [Turnera subulata]
MLSPTPLSLFCVLLLCLPLAVVFTITSPTTNITTTVDCLKNQVTKFLRKKPHAPLQSPPPPPPPQQPPPPADDESLLQVAARVSPTPTHPMKVAFMFLTTTPLPFAPLWELYFNQTNKQNLFNIYIHADPTHKYRPPFAGVFADRVIPSKPAKRQTPTLTSAARRLLAHALLDDPSNAMFVLLSPSCIPLHSFDFTYKTLTRSNKSFIEILENGAGAHDRWAARGEHAMLPEVRFEGFRIGS